MADGVAPTDSSQSPARARPIRERFDNAVKVIRSLPQEGSFQPSNTTKLRFYALYKQANEGPCNIPKPNFWDATGRAKWEAWNVCGKMSAELAMQLYVEELQQLVETMPQTSEVEEFLKSIGPFYEIAESDEEEEEEEEEERSSMFTPNEIDDVTDELPNQSLQGEGGDSGEGGDGGDGGDESDSSEESFQESFQEIPNGADVNSGTNGGPLPTGDDDQTDGGVKAASRSRTSQTRLTGQTRTTGQAGQSDIGSVATVSHVHDGEQRSSLVVSAGSATESRGVLPQGRQGQRATTASGEGLSDGASGAVPGGGSQNLPLALSAVTSQLTSLQQNVRSMLQQLNALALAVNNLSQFCQQSEGRQRSGESQVRLGAHPQLGPQLVTRKGRLLSALLKVGPAIVFSPLVVTFVFSYLLRKYSHDGALPRWGWALLTLLQALFSIFLMYYNQ